MCLTGLRLFPVLPAKHTFLLVVWMQLYNYFQMLFFDGHKRKCNEQTDVFQFYRPVALPRLREMP